LSEYFNNYINSVQEFELIAALDIYGKPLFEAEMDKLILLQDKSYASGKWTINYIMQHLIDTERIFSYRALRFAREDKTPLPGFDENSYVDSSSVNPRSFIDLINEFFLVRETTILLFKSFNETQLQRNGICNNNLHQVSDLGFAIAGHSKHHLNVIKERYYPMLK